ncbi:MAG: hypothetical protein FJ147_08800 [Deltaproteobacteria bacterium]|nr:hypothetical protein [Deltaproteobacteria bacterium]
MIGRPKIRILGLWILGMLAMSTPEILGYEAVNVQNGGSITGTVTFVGTLPVGMLVTISKDQEICGKTEKKDETLIVGPNRGIQNVVVSLVDIKRGKRFTTKDVVLDQKECRYAPHVLLVPAGGTVTILNNDGILHNLHSYSSKNPPFNKAQPKFKKSIKETFREPEIVKLTCDAHAWMIGWLVIHEHPYYAITDSAGGFLLSDVPPGEYNIKVWHESLGEKVTPVNVPSQGKVVFNSDF